MSRAAKTLVFLVIIAIAISVVIAQRMGLPNGADLRETLFFLAFTTGVFLCVGFFWGAANAGIAALWASAQKKQANTLAAFNFGFTLFLVVQVLGQVALEQYRTERLSKVSAVEEPSLPNPIPPSKETK